MQYSIELLIFFLILVIALIVNKHYTDKDSKLRAELEEKLREDYGVIREEDLETINPTRYLTKEVEALISKL